MLQQKRLRVALLLQQLAMGIHTYHETLLRPRVITVDIS